MAVARLEIRSRVPYQDGAVFGDTGAYERLDGVIHFIVDPADPSNGAIVDLDRAQRDADGQVHFLADFCLLQPVDATRGNRRLLFDVLNRGRKVVPRQLNRAPAELVPTERIDPGDGFLMRRGWSIAWCGWQWDVVRSHALMGLEAPQALDDKGQPIQGQVLVQIQVNEATPDHILADRLHQPYPAADLNDESAVLTVRDRPDGERAVVARDRWRFARDDDGRAVPDDTHIRLDGGFQPGLFYEVVYRTRACPVVGTGLLAVRDCVSFLRYSDAPDNPCAGQIDYAFGFGTSQSGRLLRHFLYLGLNRDEQGRQVFDGLLPHVAGARRGEFNHRFAQPSVQYTANFGHRPPFTDDDQTDPLTGETDGLLRRQRQAGAVPRVLYTNSSAEYWRGDCSLLHTDLAGERDLEPPAEARVYHFAGTQHGPGVLPLGRVSAIDGSRGLHPFNTVDYSPLNRAALVNLERWVTAGEEPPPSAFPRLADGTAAKPEDVLAYFRSIPGATPASPDHLRSIRPVDLGPDAAQGIGRYPATTGAPYPTYRPALDADGNEAAGLRLPDLTVPIATTMGWNPRDPETGGAGQIINMLGSVLPFPATAAERERTGDPRRSIAERYRDRGDYEARVRAAAEQLAADRYILEEDVPLVIANCLARYDAFAAAPALVGADGGGDG